MTKKKSISIFGTSPTIALRIDLVTGQAALLEYLKIQDYGQGVQVPIGFKTRFDTIPCLLRLIFRPYGRWTRALLVHDYLYSTHPNKTEADLWLLRVLELDDAPKLAKCLLYQAARWFGEPKYIKKQHESRFSRQFMAHQTTKCPICTPDSHETRH